MSTVVRYRNIKFKINKDDHNPPHVHVEGYGEKVRINLLTLEQMDDTGFSRSALRMIQDKVLEHHEELMEKWREYHEEEI